MFSSVFLYSVPLLSNLKCAGPRLLNLTKTLSTMPAMPMFVMIQRRRMSGERKGFEPRSNTEEDAENKIHGVGRYTVFRDDDSDMILDVDEERALKMQGFKPKKKERIEEDEFAGINLEKGVEGVYDIEDLVDVLRLNNAQSIFVASLPAELNYASYIVIVSGKSKKHMGALAEFIRRVYKKKCQSKGSIPHIEGATSEDWLALDLGNIILHIMSCKAREFYDLESLWSVGSDYDGKMNDPDDPLVALLEEHTINLADFQPNDLGNSRTGPDQHSR